MIAVNFVALCLIEDSETTFIETADWNFNFQFDRESFLIYVVAMIQRTLSQKLSSLAAQFPVVTVTGPRQSGKTTIARMVFPNHEYFSLEEPHEME